MIGLHAGAVSRQPSGETSGPLVGIRVLDISRYIAGAVTATILGEFGADVIKVERPVTGDELRRLGWMKGDASLWWSVEARNKRSITLDFPRAAGRALLLRLVRSADVLVENFKPGTLEKWNIGPDVLTAENPKMILLRTSGYGQTGPYRALPAFNTAVESMGGLRNLVGEPDRPPARPGIALGDYTGALMGAIGVLLALYDRDAVRSGRGQVIDNAIYEAVMRLTEYTIPAYQHLGRIRERVGGGSAGTVPARAIQTGDDKWIGISAANDDMFGRLCQAMGRPEMASHPRFATNAARIEHRDEVHAEIEAWARTRTCREVRDILWEAGVSAFPVYNAADIVNDAHIAARGAVIDVPDPVFGHTMMQGVVPRLSRTPGNVRHAGPVLGADNEAVFCGELGLTQNELDSLREQHIV